MATKFPVKNTTFFAKEQTAYGAIATLAAADALAMTENSYGLNVEQDVLEWVGSNTEREIAVSITDTIGTMTVGFPLYTAAAGVAPAFDSMMGAANATKVIVATISTEYNNSALLDKWLTAALNYKAAEVATEKRYALKDAKTLVDLAFSLKQRLMVTFNITGTPVAPAQTAVLVANYGTQKANLLPPVLMGNLPTCTLDGTTFCITEFTASNFFGVKLDRTKLICEEGWLQSIERPEVSITLVAQEAGIALVPETVLQTTTAHAFICELGTVAGKIARIELPSLKCTNLSYGDLDGLRTQTLTFTNDGAAKLILK